MVRMRSWVGRAEADSSMVDFGSGDSEVEGDA